MTSNDRTQFFLSNQMCDEEKRQYTAEILARGIHSRDREIQQLQEENQRLKGLLKEWIDQFGYPGKSLTNDTLDAIKQKP